MLDIKFLRENPEIAISMLSATYAHLHGLVAQVEALKAQTGAQRVAEFDAVFGSEPAYAAYFSRAVR